MKKDITELYSFIDDLFGIFDAPIKMRWIEHPILEKDLNPYPIFF